MTAPVPRVHLKVIVGEAESAGAVAVFEEWTPEGEGPPLHVHHRQTEVFHVLEGEYVFVRGDRKRVLRAGDVAVVPAGVAHAFVNSGEGPGRLRFELIPAQGAETFFQEVNAVLDAGGDVAEVFERYGTSLLGPPLQGRERS